jgi:hypothetical protein
MPTVCAEGKKNAKKNAPVYKNGTVSKIRCFVTTPLFHSNSLVNIVTRI